MAPNPKDEVPGELPAIDETLTTMTKLGTAFENAGQGFQKISTDGWRGATADAFQDYYQQEPPKWFRAADAFTNSANALRQYRDTLAWAQRQAEQACADLEAAEKQSERALAQYENSDATGPFEDPGAAARQQAQAALDDAKNQVEEAAKKAAGVLLKAADEAPPQPGPLTLLGSALGDIGQNVAESVGDFWRGSFEGGLEMIQQLRAITPFDPYNLTHPSQYAENMGNLVASTFAAGKAFVTDPIGTGKAMLGAGIDSFTKDPFGFAGKLAPEVAAGLATGGGSTVGSLGRQAAGKVMDFFGDMRKAGAGQLDDLPHPNAGPWAWPDYEPPVRNPDVGPRYEPYDGHEFGPKGSDWAPEPEPQADPTPDRADAPEPDSPEPDRSPVDDPGPRELDAWAKAQLEKIEWEKENLSLRLEEAPPLAEREKIYAEMRELLAKERAILKRFGH
ncbi:hypothetical protein IU422_10145 [Nocardia farcinica]|nr:hypothetical protein [Nocardia farcinica]